MAHLPGVVLRPAERQQKALRAGMHAEGLDKGVSISSYGVVVSVDPLIRPVGNPVSQNESPLGGQRCTQISTAHASTWPVDDRGMKGLL